MISMMISLKKTILTKFKNTAPDFPGFFIELFIVIRRRTMLPRLGILIKTHTFASKSSE